MEARPSGGVQKSRCHSLWHIIMMKFNDIIGELPYRPLCMQYVKLKQTLLKRDPKMVGIFEDIQSYYTAEIQEKEMEQGFGVPAQFLNQYFEQIESLLQLISVCRQGDWEAYLAALENQIKYFFVHDHLSCPWLMPLHIAQMIVLEKDDPRTWETLKSEDFVMNKSEISFTSLFTDQTLEREIKGLKKHGRVVGLTQDEDAMDCLLHTTPHLV